MQPGCFGSCFNRTQSGLVNGLDISRTGPKRTIHLGARCRRQSFNPESSRLRSIKGHKQELNASMISHAEPVKQDNSILGLSLLFKPIATQRQPKAVLHHANLSSLDQTAFGYSARTNHSVRNQKKRPSSLYGGARGIIRQLSHWVIIEEQPKVQRTGTARQQKVSQNSLSIKDPIAFSTSMRWLELSSNNIEEDPFQAIAIQEIESSYCLPKQTGESLRVGRLLGRGKYSHSYLCQDQRTNFLATAKYIFKKSLLPAMLASIRESINFVSRLNHPLIVGCYRCSEDEEKIVVVSEYTPSLLYEHLSEQGKLHPADIQQYLKQIIEATIILHESNRAHGNLNPIQVGLNMAVCKIRMSLNSYPSFKDEFIKDVHAIGMIGYQMAYGLIKRIDKHSPISNDLSYYGEAGLRDKIALQLQQMQPDNQKLGQLNDFLLALISQEQNLQLRTINTLTHPFFQACTLKE